ncbi:hypothetical protein [Xanthobacter autotrophicus]|uniref:hypothetical protein n=1 Tax=Xanthobacter autotrophicus TaxID=280 RepID=UPI0024A6EBA3|nr:hypothetical protein [Xanthobacter autotrophicus]MDI4659146.1 hypothetical protein [Xanthobacter autotrophicus]
MNPRLKSLRASIRLSVGLGIAVLIAGVSAASAQAVVVGPGGYISPAQRGYIQGYVLRHPVPPALIPGGFIPTVGAVLPAGIPLQSFAVAPTYQRYSTYQQGYYGPGYYGQVYYGQGDPGVVYPDRGGYDVADYNTPVYPGELYGGGYGGYGGGYDGGYGGGADLSGYRYVVLPGAEAAVVEPRTRRIILIIE